MTASPRCYAPLPRTAPHVQLGARTVYLRVKCVTRHVHQHVKLSCAWCNGITPAAYRQLCLTCTLPGETIGDALHYKAPQSGSDSSTGCRLACRLVWAWFVADWEVLSHKACQQLSGGGHKPAGLARFQLHGISCSLSSGLQPNHHCLACCKSCSCLGNNYWHLYCIRSNCIGDQAVLKSDPKQTVSSFPRDQIAL